MAYAKGRRDLEAGLNAVLIQNLLRRRRGMERLDPKAGGVQNSKSNAFMVRVPRLPLPGGHVEHASTAGALGGSFGGPNSLEPSD